MTGDIISNLKDSIINKVTSLISSHNNNNTAHSDMRILLNSKIDKSATEGLVKNDGSIDTNVYTNIEVIFDESEIDDDGIYLETLPIAIRAKVNYRNKNIPLVVNMASGWNVNSEVIINWGDGNIETYSNITQKNHYYEELGEYNVIIKGKINTIGSMSFPEGGFTEIIVEDIVTLLLTSTFENSFGTQNAVSSIILPNSITYLPQACFRRLSTLTSITIPNSVTILENGCFYGCSNLTSITIPDSVTTLGYSCFYDCSNLTSITIPDSVTTLGNRCFNNCFNLIDYQLYWTDTDIITYSLTTMPNNTNTIFTIPSGETANYIAKGYPSDKLVERSE